ncbi:hypothetical protein [Erythrobacter sp. JK5]|uniref:hypothetical protein n=1 Tax=Erythrobacter sp. JK5 TaxID=2829500 RepID=UPI001BA6ED4A|nr:hypothetical protein [Erythrobacter sp. JK5]QUL37061.1 hypothetical protein KDC96_11745 [Erythrobacter sp. JK5]
MPDQPGLAEEMGLDLFDIGPLRELYRPMRNAGWELRIIESAPCRGYWSGVLLAQDIVILTRGEDTWMSLTPVEFESQILGVEAARGHVAVMGLGMGWVAAETALRDEVDRVTIVERDPDIIAMHAELDLFARLPGGVGSKVEIVESDAFDWVPDAPVDLLMPDIWLPLVGEDRLPDVHRMQDKVGASAIYFWGQELEIARHAAASGCRFDWAGVLETVRGFDLPVLIPDTEDYPGKIRTAASQWMRERWFAPGHIAILEGAPVF